MKKRRKLISIIVPFLNEEESLPALYERLSAVAKGIDYDFQFLFVNDGSTDRSLDLLKGYAESDTRIAYVDLSRNFGKEIAMAAGFEYASGDAVIVMDADLQDPPELIPEMVRWWEEGYDDVYAQRTSRKGETAMKKLTSFLFYRLLERVARVAIQKDTGDFRLLSRKALDALRSLRENQRYTKGLFSLIGFKKKAVPFERDPRHAGKTKWNYRKLADLAIEGITSFTTVPLKMANIFGFILSGVSFLYIIFVIVKTLVFGDPVAGYPSMISIILFIGGIQLIGMGIIGEYLGRIFMETKKRPLYFVNETSGVKDSLKPGT